MNAMEQALLAILAGDGGDCASAHGHIARRERQVVEIASLVVKGHRERAAGLALEHVAEFPDDAELLGPVTQLLDSPHRP